MKGKLVAFSYSIDENKKVAYVTFTEESGLAESLEAMQTLAADERMRKDFGILIDLRTVRSILSAEEARTIAETSSSQTFFLRNPTAMVVSRASQYGMGNMISILSGLKGAIVQVFYNLEEAEVWLRTGRQQGHET